MPLTQPFEQPRPLRDFLSRLAELPRHVWLYIPASVTAITLDTPCSATTFDSRDLSPEEQDEVDSLAERTGMRCFFYRGQLEEIHANLSCQCPDFTPEQFITAIDFYWRHDAFIDLSTNVA
jgi:hypothetical protein